MAKWRNKINIKEFFTSEEKDEVVLKIVNKLIPQIESILKREKNFINNSEENTIKENIEDAVFKLEDNIEEFKWIKEGIEKNEDVTEYSYENWCEAFNNYLDELYDIGDEIIYYNSFSNQQKFIWIY